MNIIKMSMDHLSTEIVSFSCLFNTFHFLKIKCNQIQLHFNRELQRGLWHTNQVSSKLEWAFELKKSGTFQSDICCYLTYLEGDLALNDWCSVKECAISHIQSPFFYYYYYKLFRMHTYLLCVQNKKHEGKIDLSILLVKSGQKI